MKIKIVCIVFLHSSLWILASDATDCADGTCAASEARYKTLWSKRSPFGLVRVVRSEIDGMGVLTDFLLSGTSIVGAKYVPEELHDQSVFMVFNVLSALRFQKPAPRRALMIGLGAGTLPSMFRDYGIPSDVIELNPVVVAAAAEHFGFKANSVSIGDARDVIFRERKGNAIRYDTIVHDMYSGSTPIVLFSQEFFARIRDAWLSKRGLLIVNFIGFNSPNASDDAAEAYPLSIAIARTLRAVFPVVRCFAEGPPSCPKPKEEGEPWGCVDNASTNIMCFSSATQWKLQIPTTGDFHDPEENTAFWLINHFQEWEVLRLESFAGFDHVDIIRNDTSSEVLHRAMDIAAASMAAMQHELLPARFWSQLILEGGGETGLVAEADTRDFSDNVLKRWAKAFWLMR